jgi:hypothetical protein
MQLRLVITFVLLSSLRVFAQSGFCASGGQINGDGGSISFTCGQLVIDTFEGVNSTVSHGLQQPIEYSFLAGKGESYFIQPAIKIFPNPAKEKIQIIFNEPFPNNSGEKIRVNLNDIRGTCIVSFNISNQTEMIDISFLPAGIYIMQFISENHSLSRETLQTLQLIIK